MDNTYYPYFTMNLQDNTFHLLCADKLLFVDDPSIKSVTEDNIAYFLLPLDNHEKEMDYSYLANQITEITIDESFKNCKPTSISFWFKDLYNLIKINNLENLDTSELIDISEAFDGCKKLKHINLSCFNTDKVINMSYAFANCPALIELDLSAFSNKAVIWDTDNQDRNNGFDNMFWNDVNLQTIYISNKWINESSDVFTKSGWLFQNCPKLIGEKGTKSKNEEFDAYLAKADEENSPGLFTLKKED